MIFLWKYVAPKMSSINSNLLTTQLIYTREVKYEKAR